LTRVIGLSDAIFAVVLTLLVLDLKPEEAVPGSLSYGDLVALWPRLFAFFLTFLVGGSFWVDHHQDMETVVNRDRALLWLNLMFLLAISLLPFTTAVVGRDNTNSASWTLYALNMICCGLTLTSVWAYSALVGLSKPSLHAANFAYQLGGHLIVPAIFAISIPIAFISPRLAPFPALLLPIAFRVYRRLPGYRPPPTAQREVPAAARAWRVVGYTPVILFAVWTAVLIATNSI
jgi:uncharacterized membrane protein